MVAVTGRVVLIVLVPLQRMALEVVVL